MLTAMQSIIKHIEIVWLINGIDGYGFGDDKQLYNLKTGRKIKLKTQFSGSYDSILSFYKDVDLVVIASEADTGPSLFSDACLSDVPSVSTKIGFPKMVIQHEKNGLFVNRDIDEVKNAIIKLYDDRILLKKFSKTIKQDYLKLLDNQISINNLKNYINTL